MGKYCATHRKGRSAAQATDPVGTVGLSINEGLFIVTFDNLADGVRQVKIWPTLNPENLIDDYTDYYTGLECNFLSSNGGVPEVGYMASVQAPGWPEHLCQEEFIWPSE